MSAVPTRVHDRVTALVRIIVEVEAGLRPARHLRPFIHPDLQAAMGALLVPSEVCRRLGTVHVQRVANRLEAVAVLHEGSGRAQALILTLQRHGDAWVVTHLDRPGRRPVRLAPRPEVLPLRTWHTAPSPPSPAQPITVPAGWRRTA